MATLRSTVWGVEQTYKAATMDYKMGLLLLGITAEKTVKKLLNAKGGCSCR